VVFWTDNADGPDPAPPLQGSHRADLVIVGGGYSGLWAALQALEESPGRSVMVLEAEVCGFGASSRNGGFCSASLTHGLSHGVSMWPEDRHALRTMGHANLVEIETALERHGIDADFAWNGSLEVATASWQVPELEALAKLHDEMASPVELLDAEATRHLVNSPTYLGGMLMPVQTALVDPARLVWGLRRAVESLGGVIHDHTRVDAIDDAGSGLDVRTGGGVVRAERVIVATNAYAGPIKRARRYMVPVYDHVLMTEPLSAEQMDSIGWRDRQGVGDAANQFHYYRLSADNRILWGGYDATYHFNNGIDPSFDLSDDTHRKLADHFYETFPQLEDVAFSHRWGGPIGTTSQFTCTWGVEHGGRLAWVVGYTGLGVAASRFGARVALDLVDGLDTERTRLSMVSKKPFPFPPEPARSAVIGLTKRAIQKADEKEGRRGPWLKLLDRFGIGFDS
jgi:glycine/D-amino acid oxidase-like deaminating enzyme